MKFFKYAILPHLDNEFVTIILITEKAITDRDAGGTKCANS